VDITPLQQYTAQLASRPAHLFAPRTAYQWAESNIMGGNNGHLVFQAPSPTYGADLWYRLSSASSTPVRVIVQDAMGDTVSSLNGPNTAGLHRVTWNYQITRPAPIVALTDVQRADSINQATRARAVLDSLGRTNAFPAPAIDAVRRVVTGQATAALQQLAAGGGRGGGGGGGGRGGGDGSFVERPGETTPVPTVTTAGRGGGGGGGGGGRGGAGAIEAAAANALGADAAQFSAVLTAMRQSLGANYNPFGALAGGFGGGGGRGGRGGGGGGGTASTGEYRVTLIANGQSFSQRLRVVDVGVGGQASVF
jgi:hypothetical protein